MIGLLCVSNIFYVDFDSSSDGKSFKIYFVTKSTVKCKWNFSCFSEKTPIFLSSINN